MIPIEIPADKLVKFLVSSITVGVTLCKLARDLALLCPFVKKLSPISEMDGRHTINRFIV